MTVVAPALRKLEIGPGSERGGPDWITVDARSRAGVDRVAMWGWEPLPFLDASFDLVYASHVIEHVPWWRTNHALKDAHRILVPGGTIELHTIDFAKIIACYTEGRRGDGWRGIRENDDDHYMTWIAGRIYSYGSTLGDPQWHHSCFDAAYLERCLLRAGFEKPERVESPMFGDDHRGVNLGMKAVKP